MKRFSALAVALIVGIPATARADILWDLVHDAGSGGDYGTSKVLNVGDAGIGLVCGAAGTLTCGVITASSQSTLHVYGNDFTQVVGGGGDQNNGQATVPASLGSTHAYAMGAFSEKGLGLCVADNSTQPNGCLAASPPFHEIDGDATTPVVNNLFLDLTGVLNSGGLNRIWLSSNQVNEGWQILFSTTGTTVAGVITGASFSELCSGTGFNSPFTDIATCGYDGSSGTIRYLKFVAVQHNGFAGDFSVQALRFNSIVPEPGTMGLLATGLVALTGAGFIRRRRSNKV